MQMVPPFIFSSKTNRNPRQCHVVTPFFISFFNFKAFFFFKKKNSRGGWPQEGGQPTQLANHPQGKTIKFFCLLFCPWGGRTTPMGHRGGSTTPRSAGLGVAEPPPWPTGVVRPPQGKTFKLFCFPFCPWGGRTSPLCHGGGSATPRSVCLRVAELPPWPTGVVRPPQGKTLKLFCFPFFP
jgi:hypothetical protein